MQKLKEPTLRWFPSPHPSIDESDATENSETRLAKSIPLVEATSSQSAHSVRTSHRLRRKTDRPTLEVNLHRRKALRTRYLSRDICSLKHVHNIIKHQEPSTQICPARGAETTKTTTTEVACRYLSTTSSSTWERPGMPKARSA